MDLLIGLLLAVLSFVGLIFLSAVIGKLAGWLSGNNDAR